MTYTETVRQGAAAIRRTMAKNAYEALRTILNSGASEKRTLERWSAIVKANEDYLNEVLLYTFKNYKHSLDKRSESTRPRRSKKEAEANVGRIVEQIKLSVFALMMPNGKPLGDNTREDLLDLGGKASRIAAKLAPGQMVRQGLNERQTQKLWDGK